MTLSLKTFSRISIFISAIAYTALTFGVAVAPGPVSAQSAAYYTATLAQPAEENRAVAGGVAWSCEGTTCVANKGTARPMRVCRGLAREFGEITSFKTDGEELAQDKLAKCNGN